MSLGEANATDQAYVISFNSKKLCCEACKLNLMCPLWRNDHDSILCCRYAVSIIGLVVLCLFQEAISRVRTSAGRKVGASAFRPLSWSTAEENGRVDLASDSRPGYTFFLACQMLDIKRLSVLK